MNQKHWTLSTIACILVLSQSVMAQLTLSGKVNNTLAEPVPFAVVSLQNTNLSVTSNLEGDYHFEGLKAGIYLLTTRCLGYTLRTDTMRLSADMVFNVVLNSSNKHLDEVVVNATRVDKNNGMVFNNIDMETLNKQNLGQDAPFMLNLLPGAVVNSDAGNGVGYTGIRIRGTDGTRINVTINGVPVNDAESQGTFFVDMPDLVSSANNIQVQRGVGTSGNGAGAFGATINFQTNQLNDKPYAKVVSTAGSFDTYRNTLMAGTGLLNEKFTLDARASRINSAGYIDRANSDLYSYYLSAGYYGKKSVLKLINFLGVEKTGQAWNYVSEDSLKRGNRTYNSCGEYTDANGRTLYYKNETDNYKQNNFQLHFIHQFGHRLNLNVTGHYTKGAGYYEQYKQGAAFAEYGIADLLTAKGDTITSTDLVRRLWLDNDFAGGLFNLNYKLSTKMNATLGGGYNSYFGKHFGRLMWARYASNTSIDQQYGLYTTNKNDGNVYLKLNYNPVSKLNIFVDLQGRQVAYRYFGLTDSVNQKYQDQLFSFFNPKLGFSFDLSQQLNLYASFSVANKEPSGDDLIKNKPTLRPTSEQLLDLEAGGRYTRKNISAALNFYNMHYNNQLVLNGQIDNVGNPRHVNVASSYRRGLELELNAKLGAYLEAGGNVALSENKIEKFTEYIDDLHVNQYTNTNISFSPRQVASGILTVKPFKSLEISLIDKYVGKQYLDNTANSKRAIAAYTVLDARLNYHFKTKAIPEIGLMLSVYNLLNRKYETNGYTYSYYEGNELKTFNFYAPAAGIYFLAGFSLKF